MGKILVGIDYSEAGRHALAEAIRLAREEGATLLMVHALPRRHGYGTIFGEDAIEFLQQHHEELEMEHAVELTTEWASEARAEGLDVETVVCDGPPAAAIIEVAREHNASMVVVGTHGRSGFKRFVLGSVAGEVVRKARRPVLVVPTPES